MAARTWKERANLHDRIVERRALDRMLDDMQGEENAPLVKGGQGRSGESVTAAATLTVVLLVSVVALFGAATAMMHYRHWWLWAVLSLACGAMFSAAMQFNPSPQESHRRLTEGYPWWVDFGMGCFGCLLVAGLIGGVL